MPLHHLRRVRRGATLWKEGMDHFWRPSEFNMTRGFKVLEGIDPGVYTPNLSLLFLIKTLTSTQQTYWSWESNNCCSPKIVPKCFFFPCTLAIEEMGVFLCAINEAIWLLQFTFYQWLITLVVLNVSANFDLPASLRDSLLTNQMWSDWCCLTSEAKP